MAQPDHTTGCPGAYSLRARELPDRTLDIWHRERQKAKMSDLAIRSRYAIWPDLAYAAPVVVQGIWQIRVREVPLRACSQAQAIAGGVNQAPWGVRRRRIVSRFLMNRQIIVASSIAPDQPVGHRPAPARAFYTRVVLGAAGIGAQAVPCWVLRLMLEATRNWRASVRLSACPGNAGRTHS